MAIQLSKNSIIYIYCPAKATTGGPEALHQLFFKMKSAGLNAVMHYFPEDIKDPVADRYKKYDVVYARKVEDHKKNLVIVPEAYDSYLQQFSSVRKAIWWLSIDNYFKFIPSYFKLYNKLLRFSLGKNDVHKMIGFKYNESSNIHHFAQSQYAYSFLKKKGIREVYMLSDYLNIGLLEKSEGANRQDRVLYNPKKGFEKTKVLIEECPELNWIPLENMTLNELKDVLNTSKVYIDFGMHPGKDRIPREAVVSGCCIITGKEGSAGNKEDVAIPEDFKFDNVKSQRKEIVALIKDCLVNYSRRITEFSSYQSKIKKEESVFEKEISEIFFMKFSEKGSEAIQVD